MPDTKTLEWVGGPRGFLQVLDQTLLPGTVTYRDCRTVEDVWEAIKVLRVRGAPAIGVAAAYGVVIGAQDGGAERAADYLRTSRPTAVNLFWCSTGCRRSSTPNPPICCNHCYPKQYRSIGKTRHSAN